MVELPFAHMRIGAPVIANFVSCFPGNPDVALPALKAAYSKLLRVNLWRSKDRAAAYSWGNAN
jgi:hypothetical protein